VSLIVDARSPAASFPWELLVLPYAQGSRRLCSSPSAARGAAPSWLTRRLFEPGDISAGDPPVRPRVLFAVADVGGANGRLEPGEALAQLSKLHVDQQIELDAELVAEPTLERLRGKLQGERPFDLVHIIAHGDPGHIKLHPPTLARRTTSVHEVTAEDLIGVLGERRPALIYLDACRTAEMGAASPFVERLLAAGVPAVLAMQYAISNEDAQRFGRSFYQTAFSEPVDAAVNRARQELLGKRRFAAPVLYVGGAPALRLAAIRLAEVPCPSARCRLAGTKVLLTDVYCEFCDSELEQCPRRCGALVLKGSATCRNCRKPDQPQSQTAAPVPAPSRGIA
jgi:hypothetical protein